MYDILIPKDEFSLLSLEQQKELLRQWRDNPEVGVKDILDAWQISRGTYYNKIKELGLVDERKQRANRLNKKSKVNLQLAEETPNKFVLEFKGKYDGKFLRERIEKLGPILNGELKYEITLLIKEL